MKSYFQLTLSLVVTLLLSLNFVLGTQSDGVKQGEIKQEGIKSDGLIQDTIANPGAVKPPRLAERLASRVNKRVEATTGRAAKVADNVVDRTKEFISPPRNIAASAIHGGVNVVKEVGSATRDYVGRLAGITFGTASEAGKRLRKVRLVGVGSGKRKNKINTADYQGQQGFNQGIPNPVYNQGVHNPEHQQGAYNQGQKIPYNQGQGQGAYNQADPNQAMYNQDHKHDYPGEPSQTYPDHRKSAQN